MMNERETSDREMLSGGRGRRFKSSRSDQYLAIKGRSRPLAIPLAKTQNLAPFFTPHKRRTLMSSPYNVWAGDVR